MISHGCTHNWSNGQLSRIQQGANKVACIFLSRHYWVSHRESILGYRKKIKRGHPVVYTEKEFIWTWGCLPLVVEHEMALVGKSTPCLCQISNLTEEKELSLLLLLLLHWPSLTSFGKGQLVRAVSCYILTAALMWLMRIISKTHNWRYFQNYLCKTLLPTQFSLPNQSTSEVSWDQLRENTTLPEITLRSGRK